MLRILCACASEICGDCQHYIVWSSSQQQQQQPLQLKQLDNAEHDKSADVNFTREEEDTPEIIYADIVKPTNSKEPEVIYVNMPNPQPGASNNHNDNGPVIYQELHPCDLSDLYAKVSR